MINLNAIARNPFPPFHPRRGRELLQQARKSRRHEHFSTRSRMSVVQIKYCDVPVYLRNGGYFRSLDNTDQEAIIEVPADSFHSDSSAAKTIGEFSQLLRVMIFWMLDKIPSGVIKFCRQRDVSIWRDPLMAVPGVVEANIHTPLLTAFQVKDQIPLEAIIKTGSWEIMTYAAKRTQDMENNPATVMAARQGHLQFLQWLHEKGFEWHVDTCTEASRLGQLECLKYAHQNGCPWDSKLYTQAAQNGHLECMQYAHEEGLTWDPVQIVVCFLAAGNGQVACLQYAHQNGCPLDSDMYLYAAEKGHVNCIEYLHQQGLQWTPELCDCATTHGQLECLQYAHTNGCPWDDRVVLSAIQQNSVPCLQYALQEGCPVHKDAYLAACEYGHLECLQLLHHHGVPVDATTCAYAAKHSSIACLQYLRENGCPWDDVTPSVATAADNIDVLRYALEHDCPSSGLLFVAAYGASMKCMKYLVEERGLRVEEDVFIAAVVKGNLVCLQYLLDRGYLPSTAVFPADESRLKVLDKLFAKRDAQFLSCVKLAVERGWVISPGFVDFVMARDANNCKKYFQQEGWIEAARPKRLRR